MQKPKRPKLKRYPNSPSIKASIKKWEAYRIEITKIKKANEKKIEVYKKQLKEYKKYLGGSSSAALVTLPPKNTPPTLLNAKKLI